MPAGYNVQIDPEAEEGTVDFEVTFYNGTTEKFVLFGEVES